MIILAILFVIFCLFIFVVLIGIVAYSNCNSSDVIHVPKANFERPSFPKTPKAKTFIRRDEPCIVHIPKASMKNRPSSMPGGESAKHDEGKLADNLLYKLIKEEASKLSPEERVQFNNECLKQIRKIVLENQKGKGE